MSKPTKVSDDPRFAQAVQNYEAGLKALQTHKYDRAKACFEKVVGGASPELADRAAVHLNTCNQHLSRAANQFKTPEEQYDYAISLMNMGDYVTARENFEALVSKHPQARLHLVRHGGAELPDGPFSRGHHQLESRPYGSTRPTASRRATIPTSKISRTIRVSPNCFILIPVPTALSVADWHF